MFLAGLAFVMSAGGVYILLRSIPSHDEIQGLREEKAQLLNTIHVLEQKGGRATVNACLDANKNQRLCINVVDDRTGKKYHMVIDGY